VVGSVDPQIGRIGPNQVIKLSALAVDQGGAVITSFEWQFPAADGWVNIASQVAVPSLVSDGAYQASVQKSIAAETAGMKLARLTAMTATATVTVGVPVQLTQNRPPVITGFIGGIVASNTVLTAIASDPDGDLLNYVWGFTTPLGSYYGNPASVLPTGPVVVGSLVVTDAFGGMATAAIPGILVTSPLTATAVAGQPFSYTMSAMCVGTPTYVVTGLPAGLTVSGNKIVGTPVAAGVATVSIRATALAGTDVRTLKLTVAGGSSPPPAPVNVKVNASFTPFYVHGQSLIFTWDIINDNISLGLPTTIIDLFDLTDLLKAKGTISVPAGTFRYVLTNVALQAMFGGQPTVVARLSTLRGVPSSYYQEITVAKA
jgi:hypothetical protein